MDHPAIAQVVTFATPHALLGEEIAAAVVLREHTSATDKEIQAFAATRLADFKVPRQVLILKEIPKGPTVKLQRIGLAEKLGLTASAHAEAVVQAAFKTPRTSTEARLAAIWAQVLGVEPVGIDDNFFQLGGNSILGAQILSRVVETMHVELSFRVFFEMPTLADLAEYIETICWTTQAHQALSMNTVGEREDGEL